MGLLDGILGGVIGAEALSLVKDYIEKHGGIQGVVAEFEKTGFGQQAKSWVSTGPNLPINPEQMHQALGSEKLKELAAERAELTMTVRSPLPGAKLCTGSL